LLLGPAVEEQMVLLSVGAGPVPKPDSPKLVDEDSLAVLVLDRTYELPANSIEGVDGAGVVDIV